MNNDLVYIKSSKVKLRILKCTGVGSVEISTPEINIAKPEDAALNLRRYFQSIKLKLSAF